MKKGAKIVQLVGENFKKLRVVEIDPSGRIIQLTGKNGQGKTSVLDLIWFLLKGQKALPNNKQSVVRNGAERTKGRLRVRGEDLEFVVTRSLGRDGNPPTLQIEMLKGKRDKTPQDFLDDLFGALTFDPLEFIHMDTKEQIAELQRAAKVDIDFEAIEEANETDYKERHGIKREIGMLEGQLAGITVLEGLPKEKLDEAAILARLNEAGELNRRAQEIFAAKQKMGAAAAQIGVEKIETERRMDAKAAEIEKFKAVLKAAEAELKNMEGEVKKIEARHKKAEAEFEAAPSGEPVDVTALTTELQSVQRTNRAIDARSQWQAVKDQIDAKQKKADALTRQMEARNEKKATAVANAKIPVEGLSFDASKIEYKGVLLENLGEAEQIRISTLIGMAANPKLRVMCIRHGEALDEDGLKVMAQLAEEHDFQIWMARVDSSGKVGIVLEDGMVAAVNEEVTA